VNLYLVHFFSRGRPHSTHISLGTEDNILRYILLVTRQHFANILRSLKRFLFAGLYNLHLSQMLSMCLISIAWPYRHTNFGYGLSHLLDLETDSRGCDRSTWDTYAYLWCIRGPHPYLPISLICISYKSYDIYHYPLGHSKFYLCLASTLKSKTYLSIR
jgi:hypothetical protein